MVVVQERQRRGPSADELTATLAETAQPGCRHVIVGPCGRGPSAACGIQLAESHQMMLL